jgi:hypothetical protein
MRPTFGVNFYNARQIVKNAQNITETNRGPFLTSPLGANFDPRGKVVPQG